MTKIEKIGPVAPVFDFQRAAERQAVSAAAIAEIKAAGAVPSSCGPDIPVAPARGDVSTFRPMELVPGTVGVARDTGHWERGEDQRRRGARIKDVFDRIEDEARKAHKARGEGAGRLVLPFTPAQVQIGRDYRNLVERRAAGGIKCASLEAAGRRSGGGGGEFADAFCGDGRRLMAMRRRVGDGASLVIRRVRPSLSGRPRSTIRDMRLVDLVCLEDKDPTAVLEMHGWAVKGATREAVRKALAAALDRMMGYRDTRSQDRA